MAVFKATIYFCERCSHVWQAKGQNLPLPKVCPNGQCKSPYWNVPRKPRSE